MSLPVFGKFEIFTTYLKVQQEALGMPTEEAKQYGYAIAVLGANAKRGIKKGGKGGGISASEAAEAASKKKKRPITAEDYDKLHRRRFGKYSKEFESDIAFLIDRGLSYDEVKELAKIPPTWGAKITWEHWKKQVNTFREGL